MSLEDRIVNEAMLKRPLRYGENPHQTPAGLYAVDLEDPLALHRFDVIEGELGYVNWTDVDRAMITLNQIVAVLEHNYQTKPYVAVGVKHGNACGAAAATTTLEAIKEMVTGQPQDLMGGVVITNFPFDEEAAEALTHYLMADPNQKRILDVIATPAIDEGAIAMLHRKEARCKMLTNPTLTSIGLATLRTGTINRPVRGGLLAQPAPQFIMDLNHDEMKKYGAATPDQERALLFGWAIGSTSNSNTISLVRHTNGSIALLANGVGQQSRVGGARLAIDRAECVGRPVFYENAVAYSDSFFPFPDGPQTLITAGVKAILATSGSIRDQKIIDYCKDEETPLYLIPDKVARGFFQH